MFVLRLSFVVCFSFFFQDEIDTELSISEATKTATEETATEDKSVETVTSEGEGGTQSSSKRRKRDDDAADTKTERGKSKPSGKAARGRDAAEEGVKWKQKSGSGGVKGAKDDNDDNLVCVVRDCPPSIGLYAVQVYIFCYSQGLTYDRISMLFFHNHSRHPFFRINGHSRLNAFGQRTTRFTPGFDPDLTRVPWRACMPYPS